MINKLLYPKHSALNFTGGVTTSWVEFTNDSSFLNPFTCMLIAKPHSLMSGDDAYVSFGDGNGWSLYPPGANGFGLRSDPVNSGANGRIQTNSTVVTQDKYNVVVFQYDVGSLGKFFTCELGGDPVEPGSYNFQTLGSGSATSTTELLMLGNHPFKANWSSFDGDIAFLAIWPRIINYDLILWAAHNWHRKEKANLVNASIWCYPGLHGLQGITDYSGKSNHSTAFGSSIAVAEGAAAAYEPARPRMWFLPAAAGMIERGVARGVARGIIRGI